MFLYIQYIQYTFNIRSIDIQYVDIKYVLHHALQLALRDPNETFLYIQAFNIHSIDIQYVLHHALQYFNVYSLFVRLMILTHLLSYPNSRDAIASKNTSPIQFLKYWLTDSYFVSTLKTNKRKLYRYYVYDIYIFVICSIIIIFWYCF